MQKNGKKQRDWHDAATRWLIFFGVAIVLSVMLWLGWSLTNRRNPIPVFGTLTTDSTVSIGLRDAPESLDIRTRTGLIMADLRRRTDLHLHPAQRREIFQRPLT